MYINYDVIRMTAKKKKKKKDQAFSWTVVKLEKLMSNYNELTLKKENTGIFDVDRVNVVNS